MSGRHGSPATHPGGSGTTAERLFVPGRSFGRAFAYRVSAVAKFVGLVAFVVCVALTPRKAVLAFAVDAAVLLLVILTARLPISVVLRRLSVILPFVVMAIIVAFIGHGPRVDVAGVSLSEDGVWAAWGIIAKAVLGAGASIVFAATTPLAEVMRALTVLRVPSMFVAIISFMFRYLDVLVDEIARTRRAMTARGYDPRWLWQVRPMASAAGSMFVRSYERGERVHLAMSARGFTGAMPDVSAQPMPSTGRWQGWVAALTPALVALIGLVYGLWWGVAR